MGYLKLLVPPLFLIVSWTTASTPFEYSFKQCMSKQLRAYTNSLETIFSSKSAFYSHLLESFQQNPRWVNSTSSKPLFTITAFHESEIQAVIFCSRRNGLQVNVLSGGHDYEGLSYLSNTPFIIIDLINLRSININLAEETAWVQSGATIGELYYEIAKASRVHGFPAGLCPSVGVGGHFSGGGFGTMLRKYGLAADNVLDAYLIDVNGRILSRNQMGEDVFWAIRGGGGASFGIILSWKIKLVRFPPIVTGFTISRTLEEGATKLVHRWQYIADKLHEDLFIRVIIGSQSHGNQKTVRATVNSLFLGGIDRLIPLMNKSFPELGLQAKDCVEMSWIQSVLYFAGHQKWQPLEVLRDRTTIYKSFFKAKSDFVTQPIPEYGLQGIWKMVMEEEELAILIMDPFGGKMNEISECEIAFPHRRGNIYNIQYMVKWKENGVKETNRHVHWIRMLHRYMTPYVSRSPRAAYVNYRDLDLGINKQGNSTSYLQASVWGRMYFKDNFKRLAQAKTRIDLYNFFRNEQSIPLFP